MPPKQEEFLPRAAFATAVTTSQLFGIGAMIMIGVWMSMYRGGFDWDGSEKQFNYHPLFMIIGLVFLNAEALISYRVFRYETRVVVKTMHACLQVAAFIFVVVAMLAVFDYHNHQNMANITSLHSWIGMIIVVLFGLQVAFGIIVFVLPGVPDQTKNVFRRFHKFSGVSIFVGSIAQCLIGISKISIFRHPVIMNQLTDGMLIAVAIALSLSSAAIGLIIRWLVHWHHGFMWKRYDFRMFNYHPLFMTLGFIFLAPAGAAVYRVSPHGISKFWQKIAHSIIQFFALVFACIGFGVVVQYHNDFGYKNFIDVHSWCGLATFSLFILQFVVGFISFLFPRLPDYLRAKVAKWHAISGKTIVLLAILTAVNGVTRFMSKNRNGIFTKEQKVADSLAIVLYVLFGVVFYMLTQRRDHSARLLLED